MNSHPETLAMTFPFPIHPGDTVAPNEASGGPQSAPTDQGSPAAPELTTPPQIGSRPAAFTPPPEAAATGRTQARIPVAVSGPDAGDAEFRVDPSAAAAADAARPAGLFWRAATLGLAACLGAAAGSAGLAAFNAFGSTQRTAQTDSLEDLRALKESVAQLRSHVKVVGENLAAFRVNFNAATSAVTTQLGKISEEVEKVERLQADRRAASSGPESPPAPTPTDTKVQKPPVVEGWVLRSVSDGVALVEGRHGVIEIEPGDSLPGVGRIHEIRRQDGHWVVVTPKGLIVSAR
jgi:hypothetical protein